MPDDGSRSLKELYPRRWDVPFLALLGLALLVFGVTMPIATTDQLGSPPSSYSAIQGVSELFTSGSAGLALLILCFSILFPTAKVVVLLILWFRRVESRSRARLLKWLEFLGKWSMLDILVVVILVNVMELGILAHTRFRGGVYVFAAAILVSMAATLAATRLAWQGKRIALKIEHRVLHLPLVAAITPVIFIMALNSPLMRVEKWIFWENQFSVLQACSQLLARGQTVLGLCFLLFVVILPVLQQIGLLVLVVAQSLRKKGGKLVGWILQLDHWAMMDVFALAALVVVSRLGDIVRVEPQQGLKLYAVAGALSLYTSLQVHRIFRFE